MSTVTIAVDLAKNVFEVAVAARTGTVRERRRLTRAQYLQFWGQRTPCRVVMEACATAHYWGRVLSARGFEVILDAEIAVADLFVSGRCAKPGVPRLEG
jgi:transposase